jgi:pimeloyl-ACP methyl ester carboxylesterase
MLTTHMEIVAGKRLRVARLGAGPPIILLHGYPDNLQIWCELAPRLAQHCTVIAFDWPGMGYSEPWPGGATPQELARRLLTLLDAWQLPRVHLIGMDMGGQPALVFAAQHPERIGRLVVMNALTHWDAETSWEIRLLRHYGWNQRVLRWLPWVVFRRAEWTFLPLGVQLPADLRADLWGRFRQTAVRQFIVRMCAGYQGTLPRLPALYRTITCPTLILWAGEDNHFPPIHAERLRADIPQAELQIIPAAEHWMAWYLAEEVGVRIASFLASANPGGNGPGSC